MTPDEARRGSLRADKRRLQAKIDRYSRYAREFTLMQTEAEMQLQAVMAELRDMP